MKLFSSANFGAALLAALALGTAAAAQTNAHPVARITAKVDNAVTTRLSGTHPNFVDHAQVGARLESSTRLAHLRLVLSATEEQEAALRTLMQEQQDKTSPNYHKWLTPDAYGQSFGAATADVGRITAWLQDQGFSVESVAKSNRIITFSGTAGQVETAFHTQINHVEIDGVPHLSNTTDIAVPDALSSVVLGLARLNDVFPTHGGPGTISTVQLDGASTAGTPTPMYGAATGTHYITPGDAAVIYNTTPLTSAGIDGTGQTVAILAQSNIDVADVQKFRSMFGLVKNDPIVTYVDQNPGENGDDTEAYLDAEWGGAMAPGATVNFIVSSPNYFSGGVDTAALYAVENNIGDIISLSYGGCEYSNGATYTGYWNTLWEEAAAQGQTAFVSSGDSGAAGCESSSAPYAGASRANGAQYSVNSLGSSAYNVAVGGSIFVDFNQALYWSATGGTAIPFTNALSYIPEAALNQGRLAPTYLNSASTAYQTGSGIFAAGGGISIYTSRPAWQTGSGIPTNTDSINVYSGTGIASGYTSDGTHRLVPDLVNISANGHDGTLFCASSLCSTTSTGGLNNAGIVGGTSVATPVQASIQALINQKNGGRQGNILPTLYKLANTQYTASTTACQATLGTSATSTLALPASTCNFQDVVGGSITVPTASTGTAGIGFSAGAGFDEASGLGSMNVANVATNWGAVSMAGTTTTFTLSPTTGITHGTAQTLNVTVAPTSGSGTPTGDVSLVAESVASNGPRVYTLTSGSYSGPVSRAFPVDGYGDSSLSALPAGTYNVHVHYGGDATYGPSDSASVAVSIGKEASTTSSISYAVTAAANYLQTTSFNYGGNAVYLATTVAASSGKGFPTGTVTYAISRNGTALTPLTVNVDGSGQAYLYSGVSIPVYYLKSNYAVFTPGSYSVTTTYSGDSSYTSSSTTNTFTVSQLTPAVTFTVPASISSGATAVFGYSIANPATTANPNTTVAATGTVTFIDTTTSTNLGSCTLTAQLINASNLPSATCTFSTTGITAAGANTITAYYSGDSNYAATSTSGTVTVSNLTATTLTLTGTGTTTVGAIYTLKATMSPTTATGTVSFFDGTTFLGQGTLVSGVYSLALGTTTNGYGILTAGTHNFTATYGGSTTYNSSTGSLSTAIAKSTTALTLSSPANSTYGQTVLFSVYMTRSVSTGATYAAAIPPTGAVNFYSDGTLVASGALAFDPAGYGYYAAAASTTTIPAGTHTITATYVGDSNFNTSTATLTPTLTVAQLAPTVTLKNTAIAYNVSGYNGTASVTLMVTIPLSAALAAPTGTVSFYAGNTLLGSVTATYSASAGGYVASYTATSQAPGQHSYKAVLAGDTNYAATTSNSIVVLVTTNNVWVANGNGTVSALTSTGAALTPAGVSNGGTAVAIDNAGDVWSLNKSASKVSEYDNAGNLLNTFGGGGLTAPSALAIDGSGLVWVTNGSGTLSVLSSTGSAISPTAGYKVSASGPTSIEIDSSGNLWITNASDNSVTEVIGAATPVTTPTTNAVKNNTLAAKP